MSPDIIVTTPFDTRLPTASLFTVSPNGGAYLVETDPRFADYRQWLGSDYLLDALGYDPATVHRRLGDGYYEQRLVREQIGELTGRRFLEGYASDEEQFRALMEAGALFAQQYGLRPGVALSAEQMAQLTSDIVWLVEQTVTLADGSTQTVLVPQVYLRLRPGDLDDNGALLAGADVHLNLRGDLVNTGSIAGRQLVTINAGNIDNLSGGAISGQQVGLQATHDINVIGATVTAADALSVKAGGNVTVASTTATQSGSGPYSWSQTTVDRVAGLYVTNPGGLGVLNVSAGGDVTLQAAQIRNAGVDGLTRIAAGGNLNLGTVTTAQSQNYDWKAKNYRHSASTTEVGTTIEGANHVQLVAGNDINTAGATVSSEQGQIALVAGHDVNLLESRNTSSVSGSETHKKSGLLSSTKTEKTWQIDSNTATGTTLSGDSVLVQAGHDVTTRGADVVATHDVDVVAGNNIDIGTATETYNQKYTSKTSKSGLVDLSATSVTVGNRQIGNDTTIQETVQKGSTVGSLEGNVTLVAGNHYGQTGSTVSALEGDVGIQAQSVDIQSAQNTRTTTTVDTFKQKGITASFSSPISDSLQGAYAASRDVGQSKDARVNAMAAANAGYSAYKAGQAMQAPGGGANNGSGQKGGNLSVSITYGQQQSKATSTTTEVANQASTVYGDRVNIVATGAGQDSNINVVGSDIDSKTSTTLRADNAINLLSAQDTVDYTSKNSSQGWNAGVAISFGNGNGAAFGFTAGGNVGKGHADMDSVTQRNTTVGSAGTTTLVSGGTTALSGAQVSGNQVVVDAADLKIESLQDTETYASKQMDASAQVTVGYGFSASGSYSQSKVESDYASVGQQSGIVAGEGGYQINVRNNTDLKGGIITSTQAAEDAGRNSLVTGTLTSSDIDNHASYEASGISLGGGIGKSSGQQNAGVNKALGFGSDGDKQTSTTHSGINTGNITITDRAGQAATGKTVEQIQAEVATTTTSEQVAGNSGALANRFDANEVEQEVNLQMRVTQEFDRNRQEAKQELYAYAQAKQDQAREIRMANDGVETDESRKLDEEAAGIKKTAMWLDIAAMGIYAGPDVSNLLTGETLTQIDLVRRTATAQNKIVVQQCEASGQNCKQREVDLKDVAVGKDGKIYIFNNGIFNAEEYALATGAKQNSNEANKQGVYYILNPYTGNPVAEILYAGYDKLNDLIGGVLPLTSAERTNQAIIGIAGDKGGVVDSVNHSRGGMTWTNAMQDLNNQGKTLLPIGRVQYNGAAANAQEGADLVKAIGGKDGKVYQSTHPTDIVGRWLGGNPATSAKNDGSFPGSHSSYTGYLPQQGAYIQVGDDPKKRVNLREITDKNWGEGKYSVPRYVPPTAPKSPTPKKDGSK